MSGEGILVDDDRPDYGPWSTARIALIIASLHEVQTMTTRILGTALLFAIACLSAAPSFAISGRSTAITYLDAANERHIHVFTVHDDHLVSNHFDGVKWTWTDHGQPSRDAGTLWGPDAVTYVDAAGKQRIYVFVVTGQGRLKLLYFNGFQWQWVDQGGPNVSPGSTSAITYLDPDGNRRIYLFGSNSGSGSSGNVVVRYWNGSAWLWADNGSPPGATSSPCGTEALTYIDEQDARRIDVFCNRGVGDTSQLFVNSWNGSSWSWFNHGGNLITDPKAVTFTEADGSRRIHVFVDSLNSPRLHSRIDGIWYWINLGRPPIPASVSMAGLDAIAYTDLAGNRRMQVFVLFGDHIWSRSWNGSGWDAWYNHGLPAGGIAVSNPVALTYFDSRSNTQRIHLFANGIGGLVDDVFDGSTWQWQQLGSPPP
jgi:hypothetical protein